VRVGVTTLEEIGKRHQKGGLRMAHTVFFQDVELTFDESLFGLNRTVTSRSLVCGVHVEHRMMALCESATERGYRRQHHWRIA